MPTLAVISPDWAAARYIHNVRRHQTLTIPSRFLGISALSRRNVKHKGDKALHRQNKKYANKIHRGVQFKLAIIIPNTFQH